MTWKYCLFWFAYGVGFFVVLRVLIVNPIIKALTHS
jgi:hypothetical protein